MQFVSYDIAPVRDLGETAETCEPHEADYWSLYGVDEEGFAHAIGDFSTHADATFIRDAIQASV